MNQSKTADPSKKLNELARKYPAFNELVKRFQLIPLRIENIKDPTTKEKPPG